MFNRRSFQIVALLVVTLLVAFSFLTSPISAQRISPASPAHAVPVVRPSGGDLCYRLSALRPAAADSPALPRESEVSPLEYYYAQRAVVSIQMQRASALQAACGQLSPSERYYLQKGLRSVRQAAGQTVEDLPQ